MVLGEVGILKQPRTPNSVSAEVDDYWSFHPGGVHFVFGDGSIHFLKSSISATVYQALATRRGNEVIGADQY
jgi:prepilin-type processing-associated H-X9-DG protein